MINMAYLRDIKLRRESELLYGAVPPSDRQGAIRGVRADEGSEKRGRTSREKN